MAYFSGDHTLLGLVTEMNIL